MMKAQPVTDAGYAAALAAGRAEAEMEFRAQSVRYVPDRDVIEIVVNRNAGFLIPRAWIGALQNLPLKDLLKLHVWPDGSAIAIEERDIHISVHGLLSAILPAMLPARTVAAIFASRGGQATSAVKRSSAQANGRKGGRLIRTRFCQLTSYCPDVSISASDQEQSGNRSGWEQVARRHSRLSACGRPRCRAPCGHGCGCPRCASLGSRSSRAGAGCPSLPRGCDGRR
jgi:hypothetical protein